VSRVGYTPFFIALGFGDLIGATVLWTVVKPLKARPVETLTSEVGA
jgi:ACS family hexuronate transporter-like MFS transporter